MTKSRQSETVTIAKTENVDEGYHKTICSELNATVVYIVSACATETYLTVVLVSKFSILLYRASPSVRRNVSSILVATEDDT